MLSRQPPSAGRQEELDGLAASTGREQRPTVRASDVAKLGRTVYVKGELTGSEDLTIDGRVEGRIDLPDQSLTIEPNAVIEADIVAKTVIAFGSIIGGVTARERLEIRRSGSIVGKVVCGRLAIHEGAYFEGKIEMARRPATSE
jgi:cytoskeletal protein CcmA (bactofilin family)